MKSLNNGKNEIYGIERNEEIPQKNITDWPFSTTLNPGEDDEMLITGYKKSLLRTILCYIGVILTAGILRLIMHWWKHWYLLATHLKCPLNEAEKVLVMEDYQGKYKLYYVKDVVTLSQESLKQMIKEPEKWQKHFPIHEVGNIGDVYLSVHTSSGCFKQTDIIKMFRCKQLRYIWNSDTQFFQKLRGLDVNITSTKLHEHMILSTNEQLARKFIYGFNEISVPMKTVTTILFLEVLNPFYVFQIFSVCLWIAYGYYYFAGVIVIMSIFGITMSIIQTKKNQDALLKTVYHNDCAMVVRENGEVQSLETKNLVPGDIIEIPLNGCLMHCDAVLLSGNCIIDESMLTGESIPVTKTPLPSEKELIFNKKDHSRHTLFCGTKVMQTRHIGSEKVIAIVINTGNITAKGGLIRSILYPPPVDYKFEQDSYKFITLLAIIACFGFFYTLVTKILRGLSALKITIETLDLFTIAVPPALPAAMTVGRYYAQKRLEKENIYCISPRAINVSGSIDCVCFDKTGTLTENGLDMWGIVPMSATNQLQIPLKEIDLLSPDHLLFGMVTCHSITIMDGILKGNPMDLKIFESTGWELEELNVVDDISYPRIVRKPKVGLSSKPDINDENISMKNNFNIDLLPLTISPNNLEESKLADIGIIREFPFCSSLQRMSVITRHLRDNKVNIYSKGAPEMIQTLCKKESIPVDYLEQLNIYAQQGYRIISVAFKSIAEEMTNKEIQKISRDTIECDLKFLGFVILENKLKPDTADVINDLNLANIRTIMVTGDNILTAINVGRNCGIINRNHKVITVNTRPSKGNPGYYYLYYTVSENISSETSSYRNSIESIETCNTWISTEPDVELGMESGIKKHPNKKHIIQNDYLKNNYCFAVVGKTWAIIKDQFPELLPKFITRGTIFARMSPEQKQALIIELQNLGYYVAMCGDGANDCGALKAAHTGISLSEAESSIASPFTSKNSTISCVPNVIKEGRAALVTSFGIFKYMAVYSLIQFVSVLILYTIDSNLTDFQFLYIDLCLMTIFAFFFGQTAAYKGSLVEQPPLNSLIALSPIASLILHLTVVITMQSIGWFHLQTMDWYVPFNFSAAENEFARASLENYTIFIISCFQYVILVVVFCKGAPYRRSMLSNIPFMVTLIINLAVILYLTLDPAKPIADFFELVVPDDMTFKVILIGYGVVNLILAMFIEYIIVEYLLFKKYVKSKYSMNYEKKNKKYLEIEDELRMDLKWPTISDVNDFRTVNSDNGYK